MKNLDSVLQFIRELVFVANYKATELTDGLFISEKQFETITWVTYNVIANQVRKKEVDTLPLLQTYVSFL